MESVEKTFLAISATKRAYLINNARTHISDTNFVNLIQNIDINNPRRFNWALLNAFIIPNAKITGWLNS